MAYVGLIPSEYSSGESRRQGKITKTGNRHVRRLLIESAWSYRYQPSVKGELKRDKMANRQLFKQYPGKLKTDFIKNIFDYYPEEKKAVKQSLQWQESWQVLFGLLRKRLEEVSKA